ncbi:FG-GAP-like repeat-containing protein [Silvibacterium acidisoli]|uniref:FG-GAP-like repeat-containing protein n=1 Tax=Acidobacteriaceae bacterium ZG23-2 TaxID=2883246 RepID=UPI00406C413E
MLGLLFVLQLAFTAAFPQSQPVFPVTPIHSLTAIPFGVTTGDFNGDGLEDVVYADNESSVPTLHVLLSGEHLIGSTPIDTIIPATCPVIPNASSLNYLPLLAIPADLNQDKKLDLILNCGGTIGVILGNGDGTFQPVTTYTKQGLASAVTDLNGDGYPDVILYTEMYVPDHAYEETVVSVMLNRGINGPGKLVNAGTYATDDVIGGYNPPFLLAGDFNGDGKQDLFVSAFQSSGNAMPSGMSVLYGNGDGTMQSAIDVPLGTANDYVLGQSASGDFNHDGIADVAYLAGNNPTGVQILFGQTNGTFKAGSFIPLSLYTIYNAPSITAVSTGSNGLYDLIVSAAATSVLTGDKDGNFSLGSTYAAGDAAFPLSMADGELDLLVYSLQRGYISLSEAATYAQLTLLRGNGNNTYQGVVTVPTGDNLALPVDLNHDGLTDLVYKDPFGNFVASLGRGDQTFFPATTLPAVTANEASTQYSYPIVSGDFDNDGSIDIVDFTSGGAGYPASDAHLLFLKGSKYGVIQKATTTVDAGAYGFQSAVAGDVDGDGNLDVVASYRDLYDDVMGIVLIPGKGNGTFASPVSLLKSKVVDIDPTIDNPLLLVDLNGDKKPDLLWGNLVYLGHGDGTFEQLSTTLPGNAALVQDLNGDSKPDLVTLEGIYAGKGDGTFGTTPFYSFSLPNTRFIDATAGDVNGDGYPDLVIKYSDPSHNIALRVLAGDGKGNFEVDDHSYFAGASTGPFYPYPRSSALARINNQAPATSDGKLDFVTLSSGGATILLNQGNPAPTAPSLLPTNTTITASAATVNQGQSLTFTAQVGGLNPTGTVTFTAAGVALGTAELTSSGASISASLTTAGAVPVTATYSGDSLNASSSASITVNVVAPDFSFTATPISGSVSPGQSATSTLTFASVGGFSGAVNLSCTNLGSETSCAFAPQSVNLAPSGNATATVTIQTTAATTAALPQASDRLSTIAWAALIFLMLSPRRIRNSYRSFGLLLAIAGTAVLLTLSACGGGGGGKSGGSGGGNPGTPAGAQNITIVATAAGGAVTHSSTFTLTVQ